MMPLMRTTVTLDPDAHQIVQRRMRERGQTFKQALNDVIREGAQASSVPQFRTETTSMGQPTVNLDRALQLAAELEDEELVRKARLGS